MVRFPVNLFVIIAVLLVLWVGSKAYAMDYSGNVKWELIYISADHGCTNFQYIMADVYDEMTSKYLDLYKFGNSHYPPQCMSDKKYSAYKMPVDVDLLVLVYDDQIANVELHQNDVGGFYTHEGQDRTKNHAVVICDCSNFGFATPSWTLSHELSHFVTYYLGFGISAQNKIHELSADYDKCVEGHWINDTCSGVITKVHGDQYFTWANVMVPYPPAVGKKFVPENETNAVNETNNTVIVPSGDMMPANVFLASGRDGEEENSTYYDLGTVHNEKTQFLLKRIPFKIENSTIPDNKIENSTIPDNKIQVPTFIFYFK